MRKQPDNPRTIVLRDELFLAPIRCVVVSALASINVVNRHWARLLLSPLDTCWCALQIYDTYLLTWMGDCLWTDKPSVYV